MTKPLELSVSYNGLSYNAQLKLPATPTDNFYTAGYAYTYNVTLKNKDIEVRRSPNYPVGIRRFERCKCRVVIPAHRCPGASVKPELPIDTMVRRPPSQAAAAQNENK